MAVNFVSTAEAVALIQDGDHLILGGFIGSVVPEALERALGERFERTGRPRDLSLYFAGGQGDGGKRSVNHLAQEGLVRFALGGHWGLIPQLQKLAREQKIQGYNLPQGVIAQLYRDSAAGKLGTLSHIGLETFVDPRIEGGRINAATQGDWVQLVELQGQEQLFYRRIDANVALLRGTSADANGNISMEDECLFVENLAIAQLVKNQGGHVIVQVKRRVECGQLDPQQVRIPGILVDTVVLCDDPTEHMQTFGEAHNEQYCGRGKNHQQECPRTRPLDAKKVIARRAAMELKPGAILNLGIGLPERVAEVAAEEQLQRLTLTVEPGAIGGTPAGGLSFGASAYPEAIVTQDQQFDFYDGGGLDQAFLGLAQCDARGNLNVSRFGERLPGCGGFINITQSTREVIFCGTFTAGPQQLEITNGELVIHQDGETFKFVPQVEQVTFSGPRAARQQKRVLYITERAVFRLTAEGLELVEIAPGVDLQRDVLAKMAFAPSISTELTTMDARLFQPGPMGLKQPSAPLSR
ncbi:acyl CoA:acetate/3-ketoacid CoA transferase [Ferrimonas marina]|uniref:Acetate CoA-transferase YdiF n=1 Tax=Ferrimonas marina TaxID=299255 RepID=A0A1M5N1V1_9GAMM|nr:CoA-transferase [Ferrimonas marina]SHG83536.1 propionate CoA-transferase [Ferrimonas marina]